MSLSSAITVNVFDQTQNSATYLFPRNHETVDDSILTGIR